MTEKRPLVGIGIMIQKEGKWLFGKRKGSHGAGEYASPGGHLEFGESFEDCARREAREEAGVEIKNIRFLYVLNLRTYSGKHYAHIGFASDWKSGKPQVLEPDKCESWDWYDLDDLPKKLFGTTKYTVESIKTGKNYFSQ